MNALLVALTGFKEGQKEKTYIEYLLHLGCNYENKLHDGTRLLVVNHTATEKYKLARLSKLPIQCVTSFWLQNSYKKNKILPFTPYTIPSIFFGVNVAILDFTPEKSLKIKQIIQQNGGHVFIFQSVKEVNDFPNSLDVLVTTKAQFNRLNRTKGQRILPIVDLSWIEESLSAKMCKFPQDYSMNYEDINKKSLLSYLPKLNSKLSEALEQQMSRLTQKDYLQHCVVYIAQQTMDQKLVIVFKNMIMACGGMYLQIINPCLTHILTGPLTEQEYLSMKKYGSLTFILRVQWLLDSIILNRKMNEEDYHIRCFKTPSQETFKELPIPISLDSKSSISLQSKDKTANIRKQVKSRIFSNCYFLVDKKQKKETEFAQIIKKIRENNGVFYQMPVKTHEKYYLPVPDGPEWGIIFQQFKKRNTHIIPVSFRWVNECIRKNMVIDCKEKTNIYHPFTFKTPWNEFHKYKIEIIGVDQIERIKIKELLVALGSMRMRPNMSELTHCLCSEKYKECSKVREIKTENNTVLFVQLEWLNQCLKHGKCLPIDSYLITQDNDNNQLE